MRRQARELALQILFQTEFTPQLSYTDFLGFFEKTHPKEVISYADMLYQGVKTNKEAIDSLIKNNSQHWKIERMPIVDRNLIRIAVFEMIFSNEKLSAGIAINESVEIAKKYSTADSGSFINGILDQIKKINLASHSTNPV